MENAKDRELLIEWFNLAQECIHNTNKNVTLVREEEKLLINKIFASNAKASKSYKLLKQLTFKFQLDFLKKTKLLLRKWEMSILIICQEI